MKLTKSILATITSAALALSGLVATATPAAAADSIGLYPLNINTASAPADAKEFVTYNGKVYFAANSEEHGRAIFSTDATNPSGFQYLAGQVTNNKMGDPRRLTGFLDNIYYWNSPLSNGSYQFSYARTTSNSRGSVETDGGSFLITDGLHLFNPVILNDKLLIIAAEEGTPSDYKLWSINTNGDLSMVDDINFTPGVPDINGNTGYGATRNSMVVFGSSIVLVTENSGWNTNDSVVKQFDTVGNTWSNIDYNSSSFTGSLLMGKFRYNGEDVLMFAKRSGWSYEYYYLKTDGSMNRLGNFTASSGYFVNLGERLFNFDYPTFSEVSTVDGSRSNVISTLSPTAQSINVESVVESQGKLIMMAKLNDSSVIPAPVEHLYQWDGTAALSQIGTVSPIPGTEWLPEWPTTRGWGRNTQMFAAGNGVLVNLYQSADKGYEPYYVNLTGSATALGNIGTGTEGSNPSTNCMKSAGNVDTIVSSVTGMFGFKSVLTVFKEDGIYLKYKVLDIEGVNGICGIATDGTNTLFNGWDRVRNTQAAYKMDANNVVTRVGDMSSYARDAAAFNGSYFWLDDDNSDLYVTSSAGVETKLTGTGSDIINDGDVDEIVQVGSKLFFSAQDRANNYWNLYSIDMANPTVAPVPHLVNGSSNWTTAPRNLTVSGTKLYFTRSPSTDNDGSKVYSLDSTNAAASPTFEFDVYADASVLAMADSIRIVGDTFYTVVYDDNNGNNKWLTKRTGTETVATVMALPGSFAVNCMEIVGGDLMVSNNEGASKYLGDGSATFRDTGVVFSDDNYALCEAFSSPRGTYFRFPESTVVNGPWGTEPAYIGRLIPWAVERLGVAVTESPATALSGTGQTNFPSGPTTTIDPDDINLGTLDETRDFSGYKGSINFPDGTGFTIDTKGNVKAKTKSIYLIQASGKIKFSYRSGSKTKYVTCNIKNFGSTKKSKRAFTTKKVYTSATACRLSPTVIKAMKTGVVTVVQTLKVKRYYSTTMKAKTPSGGVIKAQNRKMTVRMGKLS